MKVVPLQLKDGSGGLNTRDPGAGIQANEFAVLENCHVDNGAYREKRQGQDMIQNFPIGAAPWGVDVGTVGLWHLTEAATPFFDSSGNGFFLIPQYAPSLLAHQVGPFTYAVSPVKPSALVGGALYRNVAGEALGAAFAEMTFDIVIKIPTSFNGHPTVIPQAGAPPAFIYMSGAPLLTLQDNKTLNLATIIQGLRIWVNAGDAPYVTFDVKTALDAKTLSTGGLMTNRWLWIRGTYDGQTARLKVNNTQRDTDTLKGGGPMLGVDTGAGGASPRVCVGGEPNLTTACKVFDGGLLTEARILSVAVDTSPFPTPIPNLKAYEKADGTRQLVGQADGVLYYEIGDGNWNVLCATDPANGQPLATDAFFDAKQLGDYLYLSNGVNTPLAWDGVRVVPWGEAVVAPTLTEAAAPATLTPGAHQVRIVYRYGDDRTGPGPVVSLTTTVGDLNVSNIPTRHANCTAIEIEMTKAGGTGFFLARSVANDPTVATLDVSGVFVSAGDPESDAGAIGVADGATPDNLADNPAYFQMAVETEFTAISRPKYLLAAHDRMFVAGDPDQPYFLWYSELGNADCFLATSFARFTAEAGEILGMGLSHNEILVSKGARSTSLLRGSDPESWGVVENIHPTRGAVDHWSFVHRYPGDGGAYVLFSLCTDGVYAYMGGSMNRASDKITPTIEGLASSTASRQDWLVTDRPQFQLASTQGGGGTQNIDEPAYEQDGLSEDPGKIKIVNQLDYIGLWGSAAPLVTGKVLAQCKVPGSEGEFYFCTDSDENIYHTTDNFVTKTALTLSLPVDERGIEITRGVIGGVENLFIFTSHTSDDQGIIHRIEDPLGASGIGPNLTTLSDGPNGVPYWFWQVDVPWVASSEFWNRINIPQGNANDNRDFYRLGNGGLTDVGAVYDFTGTKNLFINHQQKVIFGINNANGRVVVDNQTSDVSAAPSYGSTVYVPSSGYTYANYKTPYANGGTLDLAPGYYGVHDDGTSIRTSTGFLSHWNATDSTGGFKVYFTRRETALFGGGTFRPQSFFFDNGAQQYLYFLGAGDEDTYGNRTTNVYQIDIATGVLTAISGNASSLGFDSATNTGWYTEIFLDANTFGFKVFLGQFDATNGNFLDGENLDKADYLPLRLEWNLSAATMAMVGKRFGSNIDAANARDTYTYQGFAVGATLHPAADTTIADATGYTFTANGDAGEIPVEIAYQTDAPFVHAIALDRLSNSAILSLTADHLTLSNVKAAGYLSPTGSDVATGIRSNLLFVEASGVAGGYLWSDRIYFQTDAALAGNARFVQFGLAGDWEVRGDFLSEQKDLGAAVKSLGSFVSVFEVPDVDFFFRNAATKGALAGTEVGITPNHKIVGFNPVARFAQWKATLTWAYSLATPSVSPAVDSVDVVYYLGNANVPRVIAEHWRGRTYFFVAESGEEANNLVLVCNKIGTWEMFTGWSVSAACIFLGQFVGWQGYDLVALEHKETDLGKLISAVSRTGNLMGDSDVMIDDVSVNLKTLQRSAGQLKVSPYAGSTAIAGGAWKVAIPHDTTNVEEMRRILGAPVGDYAYAWGNAFAIEIGPGDAAVADQKEVIQQVDLKLVISAPDRERYVN